MEPEDVWRYAEGARDIGASSINPHLQGEPTMHPRYAEILAGLDERCPEIPMMNYTNGWGLNQPEIRAAILAHLDHVCISIDGCDEATMRATRPGLDPAAIAEGVERLFAERSGRTPTIAIRATRMPANEAVRESGAWERRWKPHCDHTTTHALLDYREGAKCTLPLRGKKPCPRPFERLVATVDGLAILCCVDHHRDVIVGDLNVQSVADVWGSGLLQWARSLHLKGRAQELKPCRTCRAPVPNWSFPRGGR